MVDAAKSADVGDSAHAGDSVDPLALSAIASVVHLAQSSLPSVDLLGINAYMMLSPHFIQEREGWAESVSKYLEMIKATCSAIEDSWSRTHSIKKGMVHLPHLTARLATVCTAYEYLATMRMIAQRNPNCFLFSNGGELYWPHETCEDRLHSGRITPNHHERLGLHELDS